MAKEAIKKIKLQIPAGKATPAPPVGTVLGPAGINLQDFCTKYNDATRDKMGDLILEGNCAYVPVVIDFVEYIIQNLKKVRNVPISVSLELFNRLPQKRFEILYKVVASLRIDGIVSALTNLSREKSKNLIQNSKVKLNGISELDVDTKVCENDIVVISGYGKFKIKESLGSTAKNKIKLVIDKFI